MAALPALKALLAGRPSGFLAKVYASGEVTLWLAF
jgi:hypothetical protein